LVRFTDSTTVSMSNGTSEALGGADRLAHEPGEGDDRHVRAVLHRPRPSDRDRLRSVRNLLLSEVERLVLDEHHRIRFGDRGLEQPGGIRRVAWHHDLQARDVGEPGLEALRVLRGAARPSAALSPQHQRDPELSAGHEVGFGGRVDELVEGEGEEVDEHDLQHRPLPGLRGADRDAADRRLADRSVQDTLGPELLGEAGGHRVRTALGDVLANHEDAVVRPHRFRDGRVDGLGEGDLGHQPGSGSA
jgi:hypothetical protein